MCRARVVVSVIDARSTRSVDNWNGTRRDLSQGEAGDSQIRKNNLGEGEISRRSSWEFSVARDLLACFRAARRRIFRGRFCAARLSPVSLLERRSLADDTDYLNCAHVYDARGESSDLITGRRQFRDSDISYFESLELRGQFRALFLFYDPIVKIDLRRYHTRSRSCANDIIFVC